MQYLLLIFATLLATNKLDTKKIKEKREYRIETQSNGLPIRKLKTTTVYSTTGQKISETESCEDSNCCYDNKGFSMYTDKNEYWYHDNKLILRVFYRCNLLPVYKDFYEYKLDNKKRIIEEKQMTFNYQTRNEKFENGKWVPAKIGDSTLTTTNIHQYIYNQYDSLEEEKIIIHNEYPIKEEEKSWSINYKYDKNRNLIRTEQPGSYENRNYDSTNRIIKLESAWTEEKFTLEFSYDENGNISIVQQQYGNGTVTTTYQYNNKKQPIGEESKGSNIDTVRIKYFYNEFDDLVRKETSYNNKPPFIEEYEYVYF